MESKLNTIKTLIITSIVLSAIFNMVMLLLTIKHDQKVTGGSFR